MKIYKTENYDMFKKIKGNRGVIKTHVLNLIKSIADKNMLAENPIIVNEKFEVIDGQHRLEAAENLRVPVYYTISTGASLSDVQRFNTMSRKWSTMDFVNSYVELGYSHYKTFAKFLEENDINIEMALNFIGTKGGTQYNRLKRGLLEIDEDTLELAQECATVYNKLKPYFKPGYGRSAFVARAIMKIVVEGVADDLIERAIEKNAEIEHSMSVNDYLRQFEGILAHKGTKTPRLF